MKRLIPCGILLAIALQAAGAQEVRYPSYVGWVNDFARVLSPQSTQQITAIAQEVKNKTGAEIAVVTVPDMGGQTVEPYATSLFERWGIGGKDQDNGILILLAQAERKVRIEVGYGLEGILPDGFCGEILDRYAVPDFRRGDYGSGFYRTVLAVAGVIAEDAGVTITGAIAPRPRARSSSGRSGGNIFFVIIIIFLMIITRGRIVPWLFLSMMMGGGGRGGGFGGGGFGGGFGGFGGGMSGGGGSSRGF